MALSHVSTHKSADHSGRPRQALVFAIITLAVAFMIIGNITAAGPAVYRSHSLVAQAR
jgi:hypothetical protein